MSKVTQAALTLSLADSGSVTITWDPANGFAATTKSAPTGSIPPTTGSSGSVPPTSGTTSGSTPPTSGTTSGSTPPVTGTTGYIPIYGGFARTGRLTAPLTGSGIYAAPEPAGSPTPVGQMFSVPPAIMPTVAGQTYVDPVFGTTIRRLPDGMRQVYSQLQAFSDDDSLMICVTPNVGYSVIKYPSMAVVNLPNFKGTVAPRWIPNSHKIVTSDYNWSTGGAQLTNVTIRVWDCDAGTVTSQFTLPFTQCNANQAFEQLSWDGQWMSMSGQDAAGVWWLCAVNLNTGKIGAKLAMSSFAAPDWVGISPLGTYLLVDSNGTSNGSSTTGFGLEAYDIKTGAFVRRIYNGDYHLDHGLDGSANEIILTNVLASKFNNNNPAIVTYNIGTSVMTQLRQLAWAANPAHLSLQGSPGLYLIDSEWSYNAGPLQPFEGEIYVMYADGSARRLAHHRSNPPLAGAAQYFTQTQATMSKSGKLVAFATNWNTSGQAPQGFVIENLVL